MFISGYCVNTLSSVHGVRSLEEEHYKVLLSNLVEKDHKKPSTEYVNTEGLETRKQFIIHQSVAPLHWSFYHQAATYLMDLRESNISVGPWSWK